MEEFITTIPFPTVEYTKLTFGKYIGSGNSGKVYKGFHNTRKIIIKCFSITNYISETELINDISRELNIYKIIKQTTRLVSLYGISYHQSNDENSFYLLMKQYNHLGNLYHNITRDCFWEPCRYQDTLQKDIYIHQSGDEYSKYTMSRGNKIKITLEMCGAIQELHNLDIVHCDLKLQNMLYHTNKDKTKQIILFDFGGSVFLDTSKIMKVTEIIGTNGYIPPEMEQGIICKKTDIYSLGVCILEIWMGKIWATGDTYEECRKELLKAMTQFKQKEPKLSTLLYKCLHTNLDKRPYIKTLYNQLITIMND